MDRQIVTLKEIAEMMKVSHRTVIGEWHSWRKRGVKVLRLGKGHPRFYKDEVLRMFEGGSIAR